MNQENMKRVQAFAQEVGDLLKGKLPSVKHLYKRNSYAHVWHQVKEKMGRSYKECDDSQVPEILSIINQIRAEASAG